MWVIREGDATRATPSEDPDHLALDEVQSVADGVWVDTKSVAVPVPESEVGAKRRYRSVCS